MLFVLKRAAYHNMVTINLWLLIPTLICILYMYIQTVGSALSPNINVTNSFVEPTAEKSIASISANPELTRVALMRYSTYVLVFWLAFLFNSKIQDAIKQLRLFVYFGFLFSFYGVVNYFSGNQYILWIPKWVYTQNLTSVFVNHNTYATFCGFLVVCSIMCLLHSLGQLKSISLKEVALIPKNRATQIYLLLLSLFTNLTALLLTHSRGGLLALIMGIITIGIFTFKNKNKNRRLLLALSALVLTLLIITVLISGSVTLERLYGTSSDKSLRDEVYISTIHGILDAPFLGWGYGTFEETFRAFYKEEFSYFNWDKAHNIYLEVIFEIGIIFGILFFLPFLTLGVIFWESVKLRRSRRIFSILGLSILVLSATHAFVDFSHQIPAIAIGFSWIMGVCYSQCSSPQKVAYRHD
jgi:O-antigen ligase